MESRAFGDAPPPGPSPIHSLREGEGVGVHSRQRRVASLSPRPRYPPRGRAAYALHLAAEGARRRHRAQPRNAGRRDGAADPAGDAHRRHAGLEAHAAAPRSARHPAHHAGAARAAAGVRRRAVPVRQPAPGGARRIAFAGDVEARRSSLAWAGAAVSPGAADDHCRLVGNRRRAGRALPLPGAAAARPRGDGRSRRRGGRRAADRDDARQRRACAVGRPLGAPCAAGNLPAHQAAQDLARFRQHAQPGRDAVPGAVAHERRWACDRAASRLAQRRAAPQGRGRDGRSASCVRSSVRPRSISASTGATSTSSSMSARRKARHA